MESNTTTRGSEMLQAWDHWSQFCIQRKHIVHARSFLDFLDPVRQTDLSFYCVEDGYYGLAFLTEIEVTEQVKRRIQLLSGPHYYAYLMANIDRFDHAHTSWGKKLV